MSGIERWALVDIETTGTRPIHDEITEIAIRILEGVDVVHTWQSLIKPDKRIPYRIQALTGISNEMVEDAPCFEDIANELSILLKDNLFVAHNARFDYAFIKNAYKRLGISFQKRVLCTVKLSRKLYPNYRSHSMDNIIARHGLHTDNRHRAMGDVELMHQYLKHLEATFGWDIVESEALKIVKTSSWPSHLETDPKTIPDTPGVYLFYQDQTMAPIYIGKSINIRTRVLSHFNSDHKSAKELAMCQKVRYIEWYETAGELDALLLESKLIKERLPVYNRRLRRTKTLAGFQLECRDGYTNIRIVRNPTDAHIQGEHLIGAFKSIKQAEKVLRNLIMEHQLCPKRCYLERGAGYCFSYHLKRCRGACNCEESPEIYNLRVELALSKFRLETWPFPGPIGIREHNTVNGLTSLHIIDCWRHLGSASDESEIESILESPRKDSNDLDEVQLIQRFIKHLSQQSQV